MYMYIHLQVHTCMHANMQFHDGICLPNKFIIPGVRPKSCWVIHRRAMFLILKLLNELLEDEMEEGERNEVLGVDGKEDEADRAI